MKIGIISQFDPHSDRKAHSGILYKINKSIEAAGIETKWIRNPLPFSYKIITKLCGFLQRHNMLNGFYFDRTTFGAKLMASTIDYKSIDECDYVLVIHYYHAPAFGKIKKPIIYHSDTTFDIANNYYLHQVPKWLQKQANEIEQLALDNSSYHLSSSKWREESLINTYKQDPGKCVELEYGPCVDNEGTRSHGSNDGILRLFFSGVVWERKGGDVAVEATKILNERGIKTILTVIGLKEPPLICRGKDYVVFRGYLNKNIPEQYKELRQIYEQSDLFILPTRAEGAGIVFCESSLYGIPAITYDTGGVGSYVINGLSGYRLPEGASANEFANIIENIVKKKELKKLSDGAIRYATERLNWDNWTKWFYTLKKE